jgi:hypothetical protein
MSGLVASDPTVSRTIDALAKDAPAALRAIHAARAVAWQRVWQLAGRHAPHAGIDAANPVVIDVDATLVTAHRQGGCRADVQAGYGHHPLWEFLDHGPAGIGEPLAVPLTAFATNTATAGRHLATRPGTTPPGCRCSR